MSSDQEIKQLLSSALNLAQQDGAEESDDPELKRILQVLRKEAEKYPDLVSMSKERRSSGDRKETMEKQRRDEDADGRKISLRKESVKARMDGPAKRPEKEEARGKQKTGGNLRSPPKDDGKRLQQAERTHDRSTSGSEASPSKLSPAKSNKDQRPSDVWRMAASILSGPVISENETEGSMPSIASTLNALKSPSKPLPVVPRSKRVHFEDTVPDNQQSPKKQAEPTTRQSQLPTHRPSVVTTNPAQPLLSASTTVAPLIQAALLPLQMAVASTLSNSILNNLLTGSSSSASGQQTNRETLKKTLRLLLTRDKERSARSGSGTSTENSDLLHLIEEQSREDRRLQDAERQRILLKKKEDSERFKKAIEETLKKTPREDSELSSMVKDEDKERAKKFIHDLKQSTGAHGTASSNDLGLESQRNANSVSLPNIRVSVGLSPQQNQQSNSPSKLQTETSSRSGARAENVSKMEKLLSQSDPTLVNRLHTMVNQLKEPPSASKKEELDRKGSHAIADFTAVRGSLPSIEKNSSTQGVLYSTSPAPVRPPSAFFGATSPSYASKPAFWKDPPPASLVERITRPLEHSSFAFANRASGPNPSVAVWQSNSVFASMTRPPLPMFDRRPLLQPPPAPMPLFEQRPPFLPPPWLQQPGICPPGQYLGNLPPPRPVFQFPSVNENAAFIREPNLNIGVSNQIAPDAAPPWWDHRPQQNQQTHLQNDGARRAQYGQGYHNDPPLVEDFNEYPMSESDESALYVGDDDEHERPFHQQTSNPRKANDNGQEPSWPWAETPPWLSAEKGSLRNEHPGFGNRSNVKARLGPKNPSPVGYDLRELLEAKRHLPPNDLRRNLGKRKRSNNGDDEYSPTAEESYGFDSKRGRVLG